MRIVNHELKSKILDINRQIKEKYLNNFIYDKELLEKMINVRIDKIRQITPMPEPAIKDFYGRRGIVGVDGSISTQGAAYPHYISLMQAKAKSTCHKYKEIVLADIHSPLTEQSSRQDLQELSEEERDEKIRAAKLALLELKAAEMSLESVKPAVIIMDGPLTRYYNSSNSDWERFKNKALEVKTYVLGIIEEIKTCEVQKRFKGLVPAGGKELYDRELLFGMMEYGQMFILKGWEVGGINKCFIRSSDDPHVIGIDFLKENTEEIGKLSSLVMALTPKDGRGIPLWLDIVDAEVRITDKLAKALIDTYIEPEIRHRLFLAKREKRRI